MLTFTLTFIFKTSVNILRKIYSKLYKLDRVTPNIVEIQAHIVTEYVI